MNAITAPCFPPSSPPTHTKIITFYYDQAKFTAAGQTVIDEVVKLLKEREELRIEIAGHTDAAGSSDYNMKLSQRRARAVLKYLSNNGIDTSHYIVVGYGELKPIADNSTENGRQRNRRVVLKLREIQ